MQKLFQIALLSMMPMSLSAETMPAPPIDAVPFYAAPCKDDETQQQGDCLLLEQPNHDNWMIFYQNGEAQFMRYIPSGGPYVTVWTRPTFDTF